MKHAFVGALALLAAVLAGGCSHSDFEENTEEQVELYEELNGVLDTVVDEVSADQAVPELEDLNRRIKANADARRALGKPDEEERRRVLREFRDRMDKARRAFGAHMKRLDKEPWKDKILRAIPDVSPET